jgi:hypothetical protein
MEIRAMTVPWNKRRYKREWHNHHVDYFIDLYNARFLFNVNHSPKTQGTENSRNILVHSWASTYVPLVGTSVKLVLAIQYIKTSFILVSSSIEEHPNRKIKAFFTQHSSYTIHNLYNSIYFYWDWSWRWAKHRIVVVFVVVEFLGVIFIVLSWHEQQDHRGIEQIRGRTRGCCCCLGSIKLDRKEKEYGNKLYQHRQPLEYRNIHQTIEIKLLLLRHYRGDNGSRGIYFTKILICSTTSTKINFCIHKSCIAPSNNNNKIGSN